MKIIRYKMFTPDQQKIFDGLKSVGEGIANFYADGVRMIDPGCVMPSKANLIAHMAREIDSGIREAFAPTAIKESIEVSLGGKRGHFASILTAVGKNDPNNLLANEWHSIAPNFAGIAHRSKVHLSSKDATEMVELWGKYEKILLTIVGSFLNITNRLDVLISQDKPQTEQLLVIKNMAKDPKNAHYFFSNLDKEDWLVPLKAEGFFDSTSAPSKTDQNSEPLYWPAFRYLMTISTKVQGRDKVLLKEIVENIMKAYVQGSIDLHQYSLTDITTIIINLDNFSFSETEKEFFQAYSKKTQNRSFTLVHHEILEHLVEKLLKSHDKVGLLTLLDYFYGFATYEEEAIDIFDGKTGEPYVQRNPYVEKFYLGELSRKYGQQIIALLGIDAIRVVVGKLTDLNKLGAHSITSHGLTSIEDSSQTSWNYDWEDSLIYFIRDLTPFLNPGQFDELIDELLDSKISILERLAIHFIREKFSSFSSKWWGYVESSKEGSDPYIHEPYLLLHQHSTSFSDDEFEKVIRWIESINPPYMYEWNGKTIDGSAFKVRRWLTALQPPSSKSKALLEERVRLYEEKNSSKMIEHPDYDSYSTTTIGHTLPMKVEVFTELSVEEQVDFIGTFKPDHQFDTSEEGLGELIRHAIIEDPGKYLYKLDQFIPLRSIYANYLIDGFAKALQKNKTSDFLNPLDFIEAKVADTSYAEENEKGYYKKWFCSSISEFLNVVITKYKELNLTKDELDRIISLQLNLVQKPELQDESDDLRNGYLNHIWNSTSGRLLGSLVSAVKLWQEMGEKTGASLKWPDTVKDYFTQKLSAFKNTDKEFSIILGMEIPYLAYIDKPWVSDHINEIITERNDIHFDYRMQGVFSRNYTPSIEMYHFFTENKLFIKALDYFKEDTSVLDTIMTYAILEWRFWKGDPEGESILSEVFKRENPVQIRHLIEVVYNQKLDTEKVLYLWRRLLNIFDSSPTFADSYSNLIWFFELIDKLSQDIFELLSRVIAKMAQSGRDAYSLLRHLYKIAYSEMELSGKIVLQLYDRKLVGPTYEADLKEFVGKLYKADHKVIADNICIAVGETGSLHLKDLYNQHN